jgi:NADPH2:quinone reductase
MRAARVHSFGGPLTVDDVDAPTAADGDVVVALRYAAVNPLDVWTCNGNFAAVTPLPHIPGVEGIGTVGEQVFLVRGGGIGIARAGTYAEAVAVAPSSLIPVPAGVELEQAASMGVAGLTAWRCVHDRAAVTASDTVLVTGATGGVGSLAVQLARAAGASVIGQTSNGSKARVIEDLGATAIVTGDGSQLVTALGGAQPSVIIDGLGGSFVRAGIEALANDGRYVSYGTSSATEASVDMRVLYRKGITLVGYTGLREEDPSAAYAQLFAAVAAGQLTMAIDEVLPLGEAGTAHTRILERRVTGKLLLDVKR